VTLQNQGGKIIWKHWRMHFKELGNLMTELQIQQDLSGNVQGFKFTGKKVKKSRVFPTDKKGGLTEYKNLEE